MVQYLAKSDNETLEEHTLKLLENYYLLKELYPKIKIDWELLKLAVICHDMGKINKKFQEKIRKRISKIEGEIRYQVKQIR